MDTVVFILLFLRTTTHGFILPMTKPGGLPDMASVISHVTFLEQTISTLQSQVIATTAELSSMKATLRSTQTELSSVKSAYQSELLTANTQLTSLKDQLESTQSELLTVKLDYKVAERDISFLQHDLSKLPSGPEIAMMKSELDSLIKAELTSSASNANCQCNINTGLGTDIRNLQAGLNSLNSSFQYLSSEVVDNSHHINMMNASMETLKNDIMVSSEMNTSTTEIQELKTSTQSLHNYLSNINASVIQNVNEIDAIMSMVQSCTTTSLPDVAVTSMLPMPTSDVAFQVTQSKDIQRSRSEMKFDTVDYNHGGGYDKSSGVFTAPVSGFYIFWTHVGFKFTQNSVLSVWISKGQEVLGVGYVTTQTGLFISTTAVAKLNAGDQISFHGTFFLPLERSSQYGGLLLK